MKSTWTKALGGVVALTGLALAGAVAVAQPDPDLAVNQVGPDFSQKLDQLLQADEGAAPAAAARPAYSEDMMMAAADVDGPQDDAPPAGPPPESTAGPGEPGMGGGPGMGGPGMGMGMGPGMGAPGHMMGARMGERMGDRMIEMLISPAGKEKLGLSDEQVKTLQDAQTAAERKEIDLDAQVKKLHIDLREAMRADKPDRDAVMKLVEETGKVETELRKLNVGKQLTIQETLTPEQRKQAREAVAQRIKARGEREGRRGGEAIGKRGEARQKGAFGFRNKPFGKAAKPAPPAPAPAPEATPAA